MNSFWLRSTDSCNKNECKLLNEDPGRYHTNKISNTPPRAYVGAKPHIYVFTCERSCHTNTAVSAHGSHGPSLLGLFASPSPPSTFLGRGCACAKSSTAHWHTPLPGFLWACWILTWPPETLRVLCARWHNMTQCVHSARTPQVRHSNDCLSRL